MANNSLPADAGGDPWLWANAGGAFGLSGDWRKALSTVESGKGLRGEHCSTSEEQEKVERILQRRRKTPPTEKVLQCLSQLDHWVFLFPRLVKFLDVNSVYLPLCSSMYCVFLVILKLTLVLIRIKKCSVLLPGSYGIRAVYAQLVQVCAFRETS